MGADGQKMSKSLDNHISVESTADEIVGRVMSIPDQLLEQYAVLATDWTVEERDAFLRSLNDGRIHPREAKLEIAGSVASQLRGSEESLKAIEEFQRVFSRHENPVDVPRIPVAEGDYLVVELLADLATVSSRSEARRLVHQGAVRIDNVTVTSVAATLSMTQGTKKLIRVGKRRFLEIVCEPRPR